MLRIDVVSIALGSKQSLDFINDCPAATRLVEGSKITESACPSFVDNAKTLKEMLLINFTSTKLQI